jgi:hypothetical protein
LLSEGCGLYRERVFSLHLQYNKALAKSRRHYASLETEYPRGEKRRQRNHR